jgi:hypothetical protein
MKGYFILLACLIVPPLARADSSPDFKMTFEPVKSISLDARAPVLLDPFGKADEVNPGHKIPQAERRSSYPLFDAPGPGYRALKGEAKETLP